MADQQERPQSPGLKWRPRKTGPDVPSWHASAFAIEAGYPVKYVDLKQNVDNPVLLVDRAKRLQAEMLLWLSGLTTSTAEFDGTFKWLLENYQKDPDSTFNTSITDGTRQSYAVYIPKLIAHIGALRVDHCDGRDVKKWFAIWRVGPDGNDQLGAARMTLAVLKNAISFGIVCRKQGCKAFQDVVAELEFDRLPNRTQAPTAAQITAARRAAHAAGAPERALEYALAFETELRQWDITGRWLPLSDKRPSAVLGYGKKWIGLTWAVIDEGLILTRLKPSKTENTTAIEGSFDLSACPMVCEELAHWPESSRVGPLIVNPKTRLPYVRQTWRNGWRKDFAAADLPKEIWNRDIRAGGSTEGSKSGTSPGDRQKLHMHADKESTKIYDRDMVEAHRRDMANRIAFREKNGT